MLKQDLYPEKFHTEQKIIEHYDEKSSEDELPAEVKKKEKKSPKFQK